MAQGDRDAHGLERGAVALGARALGGDGALADQTVRRLLPGAKQFDRGVAHVVGVLCAGMLGGKERPLEVDALDASARKVLPAALGGLRHARASGLDLPRRLRERGGNPGRGALLRERERRLVDAVGVAVHHVAVNEAVDVRVHVAGCDPRARAVDDLVASRRLGRPGTKGPVVNAKVAGAAQHAGKNEPVRLDGKV